MTRGNPCTAQHRLMAMASWSTARLMIALALCALTVACASVSDRLAAPSAAVVEQADHAEQLNRQGQFNKAADEFLELAGESSGDAEAYYRLRAAEALRDGGDIKGAANALGDIKRRRLNAEEQQRLDLLEAEIALSRGDTAQASALLAFDSASMPAPLRLRALELRARVDLASGDTFASAQIRATLDRDLTGTDREQNRKQLLAALNTIDASTLRSRFATLPATDPLRPWIEQDLRGQGLPLARTLPRPSRPVGTMQPGSEGTMLAEGYVAIDKVALLLPLSAQLANISRSIRDGFLTAYFADDPAQRPDVRIYDAGVTPADTIAAYNRAIADGADHVVGPLQREAVGALFHQPLAVPVLALNHPDTGEVPPPGSAEFGLLPDAEGAQVAEHMLERGITHAAMFAAQADWAGRAARAFRAQFEAGGGTIVGEAELPDADVNFAGQISQATAGLTGDAKSGIFISVRPQQARLLVPQLHIANVTALVFGTSHIYSGDTSVALDRDLDGVEFCDAPWLFGPVPGRPDRSALSNTIDSANGFGGRLFAFGMDAYALLPYMQWLLTHPESYINGATGQLTADSFGRIHRVVGWAQFNNGIAMPIDGALNALPLQQ